MVGDGLAQLLDVRRVDAELGRPGLDHRAERRELSVVQLLGLLCMNGVPELVRPGARPTSSAALLSPRV